MCEFFFGKIFKIFSWIRGSQSPFKISSDNLYKQRGLHLGISQNNYAYPTCHKTQFQCRPSFLEKSCKITLTVLGNFRKWKYIALNMVTSLLFRELGNNRRTQFCYFSLINNWVVTQPWPVTRPTALYKGYCNTSSAQIPLSIQGDPSRCIERRL